MKYEFYFDSEVINLPGAISRKLPEAGEIELKVILFLAVHPELCEDFDNSKAEIIDSLGIKATELDTAVSFWRGAGIIRASKPKEKKRSVPREIATYSGEEIEEIVDKNNLSYILNECQRITGKLYNQTEAGKIAALSSYLNLDAEYILLLFQYCADNGHNSLRYIEKTAYSLSDAGIDTVDKLEEYIRSEEERKTLEFQLRKMFGWGERKLTPAESKHIGTWIDVYKYGLEIIEEAYNITVEKTGKLSLPYMSKVLFNWYEHGYKTIDDVHAALDRYEASKLSVNNKKNDSFDVDEFFELALKRSQEKLPK